MRHQQLTTAASVVTSVLVSVAFGAAQPAPGGASGAAVLPDTPAGRRVAAFLEVFNRGDEPGLAAFFAEAMGPEALRQRPASERAGRQAGLRKETGPLTVRRADQPSPGSVVVIAAGQRGRLLKLGFDFEPAPPHRLLGILLDEADETDLAGPLPPMSQAAALAAIRKSVSDTVAADRFSGVVLVARDGQPLLHEAWGLANRELGVPNRPDTKFNLGSINKVFTRVAIGQLAERGKLSLDDKLGKLLPDYPNQDAAAKVTVRQLLEMQSGLGDFFGPEFEAMPKDRLRRNADFLPLFASKPLLFEPGTSQRYSNGGYIVLGEIVARVSGQDYHDYVREHVYRSAGMDDTESYEADAPVPNLAEGYTRSWDGQERTEGPRRRNLYSRPARGSAAGGGYSTAPDLLKFVQALLADRLLSPEWTEWVVARREVAPGKPLGDRKRGGLGWAGGAPGISALLEFDRESGSTVVVLANDDPPAATAVGKQVRRLLEAIRR